MSEMLRTMPELEKWLGEVNEIMSADYFIDSEDAGWDKEEIEKYYSFGNNPAEFVAWFAEKYDLYDFKTY